MRFGLFKHPLEVVPLSRPLRPSSDNERAQNNTTCNVRLGGLQLSPVHRNERQKACDATDIPGSHLARGAPCGQTLTPKREAKKKKGPAPSHNF